MTNLDTYGVASRKAADGRYVLVRPSLSAADAALREQISELSIHIPCGRLRGPVGGRWQSCSCEDTPEVWPGCDVSRAVDLCVVCARGTAGGTSRWSWIACTHCQAVNTSLASNLGYRPLALGRHSLLDGIGVRGGNSPADQDRHAAHLQEFGQHRRRLREWHETEYGRLAAAFDPEADISLREWQGRWPSGRQASAAAIDRMLHNAA